MNVTKKVLLVIDNAGDFISLFKKVMEREGLNEEFTCVDVIPSSDPLLDDCLEKVSRVLTNGDEIGAVLIDIVLDEKITPIESKRDVIDKSGLLVAAELRKRLPNTPILGMTQWGKVQSLLTDVTLDENLDGLLLKKIITSVGFSKTRFHEYLAKASNKSSKRPVSSISTSQSFKEITESTTSLGQQKLLTFSTDAITTYQVQEIVRGTLYKILWSAFGNAEGTVKYFVPGFSGAKLFDVEGRINQAGQSQSKVTSWILKVSKEKEKLQEELTKHNILKNRGVAKELYPTLLKEELITEGLWHALITQKAHNAQPLRSYISDGAAVANIRELIDGGISDFLEQLYGSPYLKPQLIWQAYYQFGATETAAILATLDDRGDTLCHRSAFVSVADIKRVEQFVSSNGGSERVLHEFRQDVDTRYIHGDFHARNILVNPTNMKVTTIDFPNTAQDHAVKDFAKLETDLIFSVLDSRHGVDTDWTSVANWQPILETVVEFNFVGMHAVGSGSTSDILSMITSLRSCAFSKLPSMTREEYLLSLLSYSLKLLPYPDISLPKKAFAIQYANKIYEQFLAK